MRVVARKRPPFMTLQRWLFLIITCIVVLLTLFFVFFRDVQQQQWSSTKVAKEKATEVAGLTDIDKVHHHIWQKDSWIVEGTNQEDESVFVWLTEQQEPLIIKEMDHFSEKSLRNAFNKDKPNAVVERIQPGLLDDKPVWEVFYRDGEEKQRYRYDFYRFDDGTFIDSYTLPAKTGP